MKTREGEKSFNFVTGLNERVSCVRVSLSPQFIPPKDPSDGLGSQGLLFVVYIVVSGEISYIAF